MAITAAEVLVKVGADIRGLEQGMARAEGIVQRAGGLMRKAGMAMTAGVTLPILGMAKVAVDAASDLQESMNKVKVVFGELGDEVLKWTEKSATALGMSRQEAAEAVGTFGNFLRASGLTTEQAAEMSKGLVQLAADLASFNNVDPTVALEKLRSAMAGEAEPLRVFGVNINMARVQAEALRLGLVKASVDMAKVNQLTIRLEEAQRKAAEALKKHGENSIEYRKAAAQVQVIESQLAKAMEGKVGQLDAAAKAQAIYSIIMKDTALAQGDFARTSSGLANSQRILRAELKNAAATLGEELLPIALELTRGLIGLVRAFNNLPGPVRKTIVMVAGILAVAGPVLMVIGSIASGVGALSGVLAGLAGAVPVIGTVAGAIVGLLGPIGLLVAAGAALYLAWKNNWFGIRDVAAQAWGWLQANLPVTAQFLQDTWNFLTANLQQLWQTTVGNVIAGAQRLADGVTGLVQGMVSRVTGLLNSLVGAAASAGAGLVEGFKNAVLSRLQGALDAVRNMVGQIRALLPGSDAERGPLRDLTRAGRALPVTFAQGMAAGMGAVQRAAERMATVAAPPVPAAAVAAGPGPGVVPVPAPGGPAGDWAALLAKLDEVAQLLRQARSIEVNVYNPQPVPAETEVARRLRQLSLIGVV